VQLPSLKALARARQAGAVRDHIGVTELIALIWR
jgi:hypothetical protein